MSGFETILPFLKPIEHLIRDDSISEVMVNGPDHIFIEKAGFIETVPGIHLGEKSLMVAVKISPAAWEAIFVKRSPFSIRGCPTEAVWPLLFRRVA